jgi:hypothetical protein
MSTQATAIPISAGFVPSGTSQYETTGFVQTQFARFGNAGQVPGSDTKLDVDVGLIGGNYAFTKDLNAYVILPYLHYYFRGAAVPVLPTVLAPVNITQKGIGDPTLGLGYRLYQITGVNWFFAVGANAALGLPLASYDNNTIPRQLQVGTGNFIPTNAISNFFQGLNMGMATLNLSYSSPLKRNGYKFPDKFEYNLSFSHNIYPLIAEKDREYPYIYALVVEFLGTYTGKQSATNQILNGLNNNSGGNLIKFSPGLQLEGMGWQAALSYQVPIAQSLNGKQAVEFDKNILLQFIYSNFYK